MNLSKKMPVTFGGQRADVYGGPFKDFNPETRRLYGIKMAAEIYHPHDWSVPTEDFSVPTEDAMNKGIIQAVKAILAGSDIYVGCMGGTGRTGTFMGCLIKCLSDYELSRGLYASNPSDPVLYVRAFYKPSAIETVEQENYVRNFNSDVVIAALAALDPANANIVERVVTKEVKVVQYPTWKEFIMYSLFGTPYI